MSGADAADAGPADTDLGGDPRVVGAGCGELDDAADLHGGDGAAAHEAPPASIRGVDQGQITLAVAGLGLAGSLVGALLGSFIGPWILQRSQREAARKQALRDGFTEVLRSSFAMASTDREVQQLERIAHAKASTSVELLLRKRELPIVSLMAHTYDAHRTELGGELIAHAGTEFGRWLRGEISADRALRLFRIKAGIPVD